jgi:hypothetical protein
MDEQPPQILEYVSPVDEPVPSCIAVISITGIVLGSITFLSRSMGVLSGIFMIALSTRSRAQPMGFGLTYWIFSISSAVVFAGFAMWLIIASIGCLKRLEWGRLWLVRYAVAYSVAVVLEAGAATLTIVPAMSKMMAHTNGGRPGPIPTSGLMVMMLGGSLFGAILAMILPGFIWFYLRKPEVRAAFVR